MSTTERRITDHPFLKIEREKPVTISFEGKPLLAYTSEPVGVSLLANEEGILSRSLKYQRPRGLFCLSGSCGNCLMRINGIPNVRACNTYSAEGMEVERQKAAPIATPGLIEAVFPHGIPYHTLFTGNRPLNDIFLKMTRMLASQGKLPELNPKGQNDIRIKKRTSEIVVIGGGAVGLTAAITAAAQKKKVLLIEQDIKPGGYLRSEATPVTGSPSGEDRRKRGIELTFDLWIQAKTAGVEILTQAQVISCYEDGTLVVVYPGGLLEVRANRLIFTTGAYDANLSFENNDLPGIFSLHGLERLINLYGIRPGKRVLMVGSNSNVLHFACTLARVGIRLGGVITEQPSLSGSIGDDFTESGVPIYLKRKMVRALGRSWVKGVEIASTTGSGETEWIEGDILCVDAAPSPAFELLYQARCNILFNGKAFLPEVSSTQETTQPHIFAAGAVCGTESVSKALVEAKIATLSAIYTLQPNPRLAKERELLITKREH